MSEMLIYNIGTGILTAGLLVGLIFGALYGLSAPWWESAVGRMFMVIAFANVVASGTVVFLIFSGPGPSDLSLSRMVPRIIGYACLFIAQSFTLGTYVHEARKPDPNLPPMPELFWVIRRHWKRPAK